MELYLFVAYKSNRRPSIKLSEGRCARLVSKISLEAPFIRFTPGKYNNAIKTLDDQNFVVCDFNNIFQLNHTTGAVVQYLDISALKKPVFNIYEWVSFENIDILFPRDSRPCVLYKKRFIGELNVVFKGSFNNPISQSLANTSRSVKKFAGEAYFLTNKGQLASINLGNLQQICEKGTESLDGLQQIIFTDQLTDFDLFIQRKTTHFAGLSDAGVIFLIDQSGQTPSSNFNINDILDTKKSVFSTITKLERTHGRLSVLVTSLSKEMESENQIEHSCEYQLIELHRNKLLKISSVILPGVKSNHIVHTLHVLHVSKQFDFTYVFGVYSCEVFDLLLLNGRTLSPIFKSKTISSNCNWTSNFVLTRGPTGKENRRAKVGSSQLQIFFGTMEGIYQITINNL